MNHALFLVGGVAMISLVTGCAEYGYIPDFPTQREIELSKKKFGEGQLTDSEVAEEASSKMHLVAHYADASLYCKNLETQSRNAYKLGLGLGIPLSILGVGGTAFSGTYTAANAAKEDASAGETASLATITAGTAMVAALGIYFLGRSNAAATATGSSALALLAENDEQAAWKACAQVRAIWYGANAAAAQRLADTAAPTQKEDKQTGDEKTKEDKQTGEKRNEAGEKMEQSGKARLHPGSP